MIRPVLTEFALFIVPFLAYAIFLLATRGDVFVSEAWPLRVVAWLTIAALLIVAVSFIVIAHLSGEPMGSTYIPAHIENGILVPGRTQ